MGVTGIAAGLQFVEAAADMSRRERELRSDKYTATRTHNLHVVVGASSAKHTERQRAGAAEQPPNIHGSHEQAHDNRWSGEV